jgi:hypothetical protein
MLAGAIAVAAIRIQAEIVRQGWAAALPPSRYKKRDIGVSMVVIDGT